jgi:hypothetical protein
VSGWGTVTWEVARAGGFTAFALLTASVAVGLLLSLRLASVRYPRLLTNELHGFLTLTSLVFVGIHVLAVWADPFTRFGLREILVPLASHYRPVWMALGIVALYLAVAIWISTRLRSRIGYARWRRLHYLTFVVYGTSLVHGIATGSDTRTAWAAAIYAGSALLVGGLLAARLLRTRAAQSAGLVAAGLAALLLVGTVWAATGPFRPGWNRRANNGNGSGARVALATAPALAAGPAPARARQAPGDPFRGGFRGSLVGRLRTSGPDAFGAVTVRIGTTVDGGAARGLLEVVLHGPPTEEGGVAITDSRVLLGPDPRRPLYTGQLTSLAGNDMTALVARAGSGRSLRLHIVLTGIAGGRVSGRVAAEPSTA